MFKTPKRAITTKQEAIVVGRVARVCCYRHPEGVCFHAVNCCCFVLALYFFSTTIPVCFCLRQLSMPATLFIDVDKASSVMLFVFMETHGLSEMVIIETRSSVARRYSSSSSPAGVLASSVYLHIYYQHQCPMQGGQLP